MPNEPKAALYLRVSKDEQHAANQIPDVRAYAQRMGWEPIEYVEHASGKEGGRRPVLAQLLADAEEKKFSIVVVWKIDRFGRSLSDFVKNVRKLDALGVRFVASSQGVDTDQRSPFAKLLMHILAIFAEFERDLIIERVNAGLREYRRAFSANQVGDGEGKVRRSKSGKNKAIGRPRKTCRRARIESLRSAGMSLRAIARELGMSDGTVRKLIALPRGEARQAYLQTVTKRPE